VMANLILRDQPHMYEKVRGGETRDHTYSLHEGCFRDKRERDFYYFEKAKETLLYAG
jgi:hypothetical protein